MKNNCENTESELVSLKNRDTFVTNFSFSEAEVEVLFDLLAEVIVETILSENDIHEHEFILSQVQSAVLASAITPLASLFGKDTYDIDILYWSPNYSPNGSEPGAEFSSTISGEEVLFLKHLKELICAEMQNHNDDRYYMRLNSAQLSIVYTALLVPAVAVFKIKNGITSANFDKDSFSENFIKEITRRDYVFDSRK